MTDFAALQDRVTAACYRHVANVFVTRSIGSEFDAILDIAEPDAFETAKITTHTLRYPQSVPVAPDESLTIIGGVHAGNYKVHGVPDRLNANEYTAQLVKLL